MESAAGLRFLPLLPWPLLAGLALLAGFALALALIRRARGAWLRALSFALVLLWLGGPVWERASGRLLPDIAFMVVDHSASMSVDHRALKADRAAAALAAQARRLKGLVLRWIDLPEQGDAGTRLFAAIRQGIADIPPDQLAGVIAITDGQVTDAPRRLPFAAPFQVLLTGRPGETGRRIRLISAPRYGVVGGTVTVKLIVEDLGVRHPAGAVTLSIHRDGTLVGRESVPIGAPVSLPVPISHAGPTVLALSVAPLPGGISILNDQVVLPIEGVRDQLRVLLVSGAPNPGLRAWRRLLKSDPAVQLVNFTILRTPAEDDETPINELALIPFPVQELFQEKINRFDLIILDQFANVGLLPDLYLKSIADYVRRSGALLLSVGPEFAAAGSLADSPLGTVLPAEPIEGPQGVVFGAFRPHLTALGWRHPVTAGLEGSRGPSWGHWYRMVAASPLHGEILMQGPDGRPLLMLARVGRGRVGLLLSDQIWLWSRGHDGGGPEATLLRRVAHWLMKEPALEENALSASDMPEGLEITRRRIAPGPPPLFTLTDPAGRQRQIIPRRLGPGRFVAVIPHPAPGVWRVQDPKLAAFAAVGLADAPEFADLRATSRLLASLARASGGSVSWLGPGKEPKLRLIAQGVVASGQGWIGLKRNRTLLTMELSATPLVPAWLAATLLLAALLAAWRQEGS